MPLRIISLVSYGGNMRYGRKLTLMLTVLGLGLGVTTAVFGSNEATVDALDSIGSNFWLAASAIISGISLIIITIILAKRN